MHSTWPHGGLLINYSASENVESKTPLNLTAAYPKPPGAESLPTVSWPGILALRVSLTTCPA